MHYVPRYSQPIYWSSRMNSTFTKVFIVAMNAIAALGITYLLITICSASILYFSFKGKIDASGKYFFLSELIIIPAIIGIALININPIFLSPQILLVVNTSVWSSHVCVLFSIYGLSYAANNKKFILALCGGILYALTLELIRYRNASIQTTTLVASIVDALFCTWTYVACKNTKDKELTRNLFFNWIKNIELMLAFLALVRIVSCLTTDAPINARFPTPPVIIFYTIFIILNIFRYISYQSLRISWVDYRTYSINPLNKNLAVVTQEKNELVQGLIASNRVIGIGALASSLAHQLSQPLTAIGLQTETLKRDLIKSNSNQEAVATLNKVNTQLSKLTNLVKNLRQLFNAGYHDLHEVNLTSTTDELLEIIEPTLEAKKIHLTKAIEDDIAISGDAIQIQQVLINLLNNSIDAISLSNPKVREIKLTINSNNQFAFIEIEDTGPGINPEMLPSMFELYKTTKKDGLGVGLWLSKTILNKHHADIFASNTPMGGAKFTIQIPLSQARI